MTLSDPSMLLSSPLLDVDSQHAQSRSGSLLRLVILVAVTGLVGALIVAGVLVEIAQRLSSASH